MKSADQRADLREVLPDGTEIKLVGWRPEPAVTGCVLLLSGTSTQMDDLRYFTEFLVEQGLAVAVLQRFIGGPLDVGFDPIQRRRSALRHALEYLDRERGMQRVLVLAHSYASLEVVRVLSEAPQRYASLICDLVLINPAGFLPQRRFVRHCLRFLFLAMLREYLWVTVRLLAPSRDAETREFLHRKRTGTATLFLKTLANPMRTFREVADVVSCDIRPPLVQLVREHGYRVHAFVNTDDNLVVPHATLRELGPLLQPGSLRSCPGHHMDHFFDISQMRHLSEFLKQVMELRC
jgi:pimeloyl-ACP methyl ester carboxylesterase